MYKLQVCITHEELKCYEIPNSRSNRYFHRLDDNKITEDHAADSSRQKLNQQLLGTTQKPGGTFQVLHHKEQIPLMGGLDVESNSTTSVLGNRLFNAPVIQHKSSPNDFLLVRSKATKEGIAAGKEKWTYHVREISSLYVVGQHTPKHAVYTPNRKPFRKFQDDYVRFWLEKTVSLRSNT